MSEHPPCYGFTAALNMFPLISLVRLLLDSDSGIGSGVDEDSVIGGGSGVIQVVCLLIAIIDKIIEILSQYLWAGDC